MWSYLKRSINKATIINIMKLRLNMIDVKCNYKGKYKNDLICPVCKIENDTTEHLFECNIIRKKIALNYTQINSTDLKEDKFAKLQQLEKYAEEAFKFRNS